MTPVNVGMNPVSVGMNPVNMGMNPVDRRMSVGNSEQARASVETDGPASDMQVCASSGAGEEKDPASDIDWWFQKRQWGLS